MSKVNKKKICLSFSHDVSEFISNYAEEKGISLSVATERILLKGIEAIESNNYNKIAQEISKLLSNGELTNSSIIKEEKVEENEENFNLNNENDRAMLNIFNNIPD